MLGSHRQLDDPGGKVQIEEPSLLSTKAPKNAFLSSKKRSMLHSSLKVLLFAPSSSDAAIAGAVDLVFVPLCWSWNIAAHEWWPRCRGGAVLQLCCWRQYRICGSKLGHPCWLNGLGVQQLNSKLEFLDSNGSTAAAGGIGYGKVGQLRFVCVLLSRSILFLGVFPCSDWSIHFGLLSIFMMLWPFVLLFFFWCPGL
ncbi:hypothetical protein Nepgr_030857 [Nepenthes gracilis]|uniref:Uncharacterized protein n=1 Tax=Nepenthes gracilis TaxID=150966 RepID=A0AAD3TH64_NEPGR|nr:hypothetical protein Nepgr_030857 [Nepenthes gracilis]